MSAFKNKDYTITQRMYFLEKAYQDVYNYPKDTLLSKKLSTIAYRYLQLKDTLKFKKINQQAYKYAQEVKDTFTLADTHWSYANLYKNTEQYDSAYFHYNRAHLLFETINKQHYLDDMQLVIEGDYTREATLLELSENKMVFVFKNPEDNDINYQMDFSPFTDDTPIQ
ncbi:hypothetical protein GGR32_000371 [Mesonia hippocampi]|uniref:Uncharacterized protein n=1 Tax=Mesonia hippocampi TaxID=1628250 RepID=A0A840EI66_9FLAO|nr:hypothetical protein [Mesonia hippocampi]MBB4118099.1 hypothetical protein [Mesonia hippocampi]